MTDQPSVALLDAAIAIAQRAGREILEVYATEFQSIAKADASPLTEADLRAHRLIVAELGALYPRLPVLSEESAEVEFAERRSWSTFWLVDPLDGTKEFVSRNGEFTVNIALVTAHRPILGVVHVPVLGVTYAGIPGLGAWRLDPAGRRAISVRDPATAPLRVVGSRSHGDPALQRALDALGPHELRAAGSALKLGLVAEGAADLYPRLGPTSAWDIAAGHAVVVAAGGEVVNLRDGAPLRYNDRPDLLNPPFLAYGSAECLRRWPST
jgi:3'(2'), 5'-bisphosphate nucleotidase